MPINHRRNELEATQVPQLPPRPVAPPPGYPQPPSSHPPVIGQMQQPNPQQLCVGLVGLPVKFHFWNTMTSGGTSVLELGPLLRGPPYYSAKMFSSSRLKIKAGPYQQVAPPVCTIESRHTFSSKSTIQVDCFQTHFREPSEFHEGASWPFQVEANGCPHLWQWTKPKQNHTSTLRAFVGAMTAHCTLGSWVVEPANVNGPVAASFSPAGGNTFEEDSALDLFELHGPAAAGVMGNVFVNISIAVLLRIISQHYISRIAALA